MAPQLRVFTKNPRFEQRAKMDISISLEAVLKARPETSPEEAMWTVRNHMLANNPYEPPSNGKCPINELPTEILGLIFQTGAEDDDDDDDKEEEEDDDDDDWEDVSDDDDDDSDDNDSDDNDNDLDHLSEGSHGSSRPSISSSCECYLPFQVLVSHVCQHWRQVALNSHVLWTRLKFEHTLQLDKAKAYIDRAQGLPLDIDIDCTFREDTDEEDHPDHPLYNQNKETLKAEDRSYGHESEPFLSQNDLMQILDLIEPEVSHWGHLFFQASTYGYVQSLLSRLHKLPSAPLLKTFHVYHQEDCDDYESFNGDDKTHYFPFHGNAPLLESALFWGVHIDWDNSLHFLQGLDTFELSFHANDVRPSYTTFIQIIKMSPDLRILSLSLSGPALATGAQFDNEGQWGPESFEVPSVHSLTLQFHEPQYASALIQHFYFPNLRSLTLNFDEQDYSSFAGKLSVPVKGRSKSILSGLESLKILGLPCDVATVEAMLRQLTDLKTLHLKCFGPEELLIFEMLVDPSAGRKMQEETQVKTAAEALPKIFCPILDTLTLHYVSESQIKTLIKARKNAGAALKRLRLSRHDDISMKTEAWIRNHVEAFDYFVPSDSDSEVEIEVDGDESDDDDDEPDNDDDEPDNDDDSGDEEDEDGSPTRGLDGLALPSPIAQHVRRRRTGQRGYSDLD